MANSRYEYVRSFELDDTLLPGTWIVVRLDGRNFNNFVSIHGFNRPNDLDGLNLMNASAIAILNEFPDISIGYGQSDEFSFVFNTNTKIYGRRSSKLITSIVSLFTAQYQYLWSTYKPGITLLYPPSFDGRVVIYPKLSALKDYLRWRQVDCHVNNLYNACFWNLVGSGKDKQDAEQILKGTFSKDKHELLFSKFNINYNNLPEIYRKGSVILRSKNKSIEIQHLDLIQESFWETFGDYC
jgi:tRNA(His) guanylyltransferase